MDEEEEDSDLEEGEEFAMSQVVLTRADHMRLIDEIDSLKLQLQESEASNGFLRAEIQRVQSEANHHKMYRRFSFNDASGVSAGPSTSAPPQRPRPRGRSNSEAMLW